MPNPLSHNGMPGPRSRRGVVGYFGQQEWIMVATKKGGEMALREARENRRGKERGINDSDIALGGRRSDSSNRKQEIEQ